VCSDDKPSDDLIGNISNGIESLGNLIYLIYQDADHPSRVRPYASMCAERLRVSTKVMSAAGEQL
jgi:hypothetical protein